MEGNRRPRTRLGGHVATGGWLPGAIAGSVSGLAVVAWLLGTVALLRLSTVTGSVHSVVVTGDAAPLAAAGGPAPRVVGYLGVGRVHVYVPWTVVPTVALGELVGATNATGRRSAAIACGLAGAGQLLVLSGCGCGGAALSSLLAAAAAGLG